MRRRVRCVAPVAVLGMLALLVTGCGPASVSTGARGAQVTGRTVIVLSLDGFRHDYPSRVPSPGFDRMAAEGASAGRLIPPWPSQTFPGHASLATGVVAERHGIVNNRFVDRERGPFAYGNGAGWYDAMPVWIHATRQGIRSHVFHWVGSEGAWHGTEPAFWRAFDKSITDATKVEAIIGWLGLPPEQRPGLVMSYLGGCDMAGHERGPASAEVSACVAEADALIAKLLAAIEARQAPGWPVNLVVVADHGMMATAGGLNVVPALAAAGVAARTATSGVVVNVYLDGADPAQARAALEAVPHSALYTPETLPAGWHYRHATRTGDFVLVAEPGWRFSEKQAEVSLDLTAEGLGHHGHDPQMPEMGAVFRAWGPGVRAGAQVPTLRAVDVVPLVCHLLGIPPPPHADGRPLDGALVEALVEPR